MLERLAARPALRMCLATGSTPLPVYARLAHSPGTFASAAILLLDEFGGLPADEPERCDGVLRRALVDHVAPAEYRSIDTEAPDLDAECAAIDAWIDAGPGGVIDLAVLGLGVNGHIGMNEPGSRRSGGPPGSSWRRRPSTARSATFGGRYRPTWGVTVGLADLLAAREVWVLAAGAAKAEIVRRSFEGPAGADVPASLLRTHPNCTWWLDSTAVSLL